MKVGLFYEKSNNVNTVAIEKYNSEFIKDIEKYSGVELEYTTIENVNNYDMVISFIGGGGTEGRFKPYIDKLPRPIFILSTQANNSLPASMEILSYLRQKDIPCEILHGTAQEVAPRVALLAKVMKAKRRLSNFKIGRVGAPSDWLISSGVNATLSKEINGIEIVDIDMKEFLQEISKHEYQENKWTERFNSKQYDPSKKKLALEIYGALKRLCIKYSLDGVTVRCFDLLGPVKGTGCIALAILNAEGIYASCEGDVPALLSMAVLGELTGEPVFMANPSRILRETNEIVVAHCTLPLNMSDEMTYMPHYESGLGVAIRARIPEGDCTVFKTNGMLDTYFVSNATLVKNLSEANLCRTQIQVKLDKSIDYFLNESIGNHHLVVRGHHQEIVDEFYKWY